MKVRLRHPWMRHPAGSVVDVDSGLGKTLISHRGASLVTDEPEPVRRENKSMVGVRELAVKKK